MAFKHSPNTTVRRGVNSPSTPAISRADVGSQGVMGAPFNAPRAGASALPTKIYQDMGEPKRMPAPSRVLQSDTSVTGFGPIRSGAMSRPRGK